LTDIRSNAEYALSSLKAALEAGADNLTLCDTNGGALPHHIAEIVLDVRRHLPKAKLGIHCHNDSDAAVANSLEAVRQGVILVQGTINGMGERCGNANLISIIPGIMKKLDLPCLTDRPVVDAHGNVSLRDGGRQPSAPRQSALCGELRFRP
jgi:2-isopropylmalate synthase